MQATWNLKSALHKKKIWWFQLNQKPPPWNPSDCSIIRCRGHDLPTFLDDFFVKGIQRCLWRCLSPIEHLDFPAYHVSWIWSKSPNVTRLIISKKNYIYITMVMICDTWWILGIGGYTGYQFQIFKDGTLWTSNPHLELDRIIRRSFKKKCHHLVCLCTYTNTNTYTYTYNYIYIHSICIYITYCVIHVYLYTSI